MSLRQPATSHNEAICRAERAWEREGTPIRASGFHRYVAGRHEVVEVHPSISVFRFRFAAYSRYQARRCVCPKHYGSQVAF